MTVTATAALRTAALAVLAATGLAPLPALAVFHEPTVQVTAATVVVVTIVVGDAIAGLTLGLAVLAVHLRLNRDWVWTRPRRPALRGRSLVRKYITPEDLAKAQTNTLPDFDKPIATPLEGETGGRVYGAEGVDPVMPGLGEPQPGAPWQP